MDLLIWDFDGTLGYRVGGMWSGALLELLQQEMPEMEITADQVQPYLQAGFLWQHPDKPHPEVQYQASALPRHPPRQKNPLRLS